MMQISHSEILYKYREFPRDGTVDRQGRKMASNNLFVTVILLLVSQYFVIGCLITNCPRGGKRSGKFGIADNNIKPVSKILIFV